MPNNTPIDETEIALTCERLLIPDSHTPREIPDFMIELTSWNGVGIPIRDTPYTRRALMEDPEVSASMFRRATLSDLINRKDPKEVGVAADVLSKIKISMIMHLLYPVKCVGFGIHYDPPTILDGLLLHQYTTMEESLNVEDLKYALDVPLTNSNGSRELNTLPLAILTSNLPDDCEPDNIQNYIHQNLPVDKLIYHTLRSIKITPERLFRNFIDYAKEFNVTFPGGDVVGHVKRHLSAKICADNVNEFLDKPYWVSNGADIKHCFELTLNDLLNSRSYIATVICNIYYKMHMSWFDEGEVINVQGSDIYIHRHNLLSYDPVNLDLTKHPREQFAELSKQLALKEYNSDNNARYHDLFTSYIPTVEGSHRQLRLGTDLKAEGRTMRHCIGGYEDRIKDSSSLFFHLDVPDVPYGGTLEMTRYKPGTRESRNYEVWMVPGNDRLEWWVVNQFYGQCNLGLKNHREGRAALDRFLNTHMVKVSHNALHMVNEDPEIIRMMTTPSNIPSIRAAADVWARPYGAWSEPSYDCVNNRDTLVDVVSTQRIQSILSVITNYTWNPNDPESHDHNQVLIAGINQTLEGLKRSVPEKKSIHQLAHEAFLKRQRSFL